MDDTFSKAYEVRGITISTYYRLLIPEIIPEYSKIIYSDVDVIFREDLSEIYLNTDMADCYVAGVKALAHLNPDTDSYYQNVIGINSSNVIYAGNIIINSELILKDNVIDQFKEHIRKKYKFQDLDIINIVCGKHITYLSPCFCLTTDVAKYASVNRGMICNIWSEQDITDALSRGIVHYNGQKPWKGACINFDIWWEYYRKSPFFDEKYYYQFFENMLNEHDRLPLFKRIKILLRYFVYGRKK